MQVTKQNLFCPFCGVRDVWVDESNSGDYYAGTAHYCLTCHSELSDLRLAGGELLTDGVPPIDPYALGVYIAIREAAGLDVAGITETERLRDAHAVAVAAQDVSRQAYEQRRRKL